MSRHKYAKLKIDPEFKALIPPLSIDERKQLEENIINEGCREAICIWHGIILDGHNRYEICTRHGIPFNIRTVSVNSREEAIAWICANQLGRRNISDETRKYLIGKRYEAEKSILSNNRYGKNQHSERPVLAEDDDDDDDDTVPQRAKRHNWTARNLGEEYHMSHSTIQKYGAFAKAVDVLGKKDPALPPKLLSGTVKMSHENLIHLSKLPAREVKKLSKQLRDGSGSFVSYSDSRRGMEESGLSPDVLQVKNIGAIKEMPTFDPDAEISGLTLTIPSWISSLERVKKATDFQFTTKPARKKLENALLQLRRAIDEIVTDIREA